MKRIIPFLAFMLIFPYGIWAHGSTMSPETIARETTEKVLAYTRINRELYKNNPEELEQMLRNTVAIHIDFEYVTRIILGKYWRKASPMQKKRFSEALQKTLISTFSVFLFEYESQKIMFREEADTRKERARIFVTFVQKSGERWLFLLHFRKKDTRWYVINVEVPKVGFNFLASQRSMIYAQIERNGLSKTIELMEGRIK